LAVIPFFGPSRYDVVYKTCRAAVRASGWAVSVMPATQVRL